MSGTVAERVEAYCKQAGMGQDEPLRLMLLTVAQAVDETNAAADRMGREVARRAVTAAMAEMRSHAVKLLQEIAWIKRLAVAGLIVVSAGGGWWAGQRMPQLTPLGRLTPAQAEALRLNDFGVLLDGCTRQAPQGGREWCQFTHGWWLSPPVVMAGGKER
jgi:hypothetical protein